MAQADIKTTAREHDPDARLRFEGTVELGGALTGEMLGTLFNERSNVSGKLQVKGELRIDGTFRGSISTDEGLLIGEHARVQAEVSGGSVVVKGEVTGNITARESVALHAGSRVKGDITSPALSVDRGAMFDGASRMETTPAKGRRAGR